MKIKYLIVRGPKQDVVHFSYTMEEAVQWFTEASKNRNMKDCKIIPFQKWLYGVKEKWAIN